MLPRRGVLQRDRGDPIDAPDTAAFLERAVRFANETLWGTLNATLIVDPRTAKDPASDPLSSGRSRACGTGRSR